MNARYIIDLWPDRADLAHDLGIPLNLVRTWYHRQRIPAEWFVAIVDSARKHDLPVTYEILARARANGAARQPDEAA